MEPGDAMIGGGPHQPATAAAPRFRAPAWATIGLLIALTAYATAQAQTTPSSGEMAPADPSILASIFAWFTDPASWQGPNGIPTRIVEHIYYVAVSMAFALAVALPVGIGLGHWGRGGLIAINLSNIGRAIPEFGVVILVFLIAGYGDLPIIVTLFALALPPIVTNSYVGMTEVSADARQAAKGLGMTGWQRLWQVELPIALPVIMAGIRTSTVQVMATATLAAYVGLGGVGRYIIDGLALRDMIEVVCGAIIVAILALGIEAILAVVQRLVVSRGLKS